MIHHKIVLICFFSFFAVPAICQNGNDTINQTNEDGHKTGYWKKTNEEGMLLYEGHFENDVPVGEFTYYYPDGIVKAKTEFFSNGARAMTITYHHSGKKMSEGIYVNKEKDSLWRYYDSEGILLKEEFYKDQQKHDTWKTFYASGQVAEETTWEYGVQQGPWRQYFSDGQLKSSGNFANNEKQGTFDYYYPNGRLRTTGNYENGYKTGEWFYMDEEGKVIKKEVYSEGRLVSKEEYE